MKIRITNIDSGLKVGQEYDLCGMATKCLIDRGHALLLDKVIPDPVVKSKEVKPVKKEKNEPVK